MFAVLANIFLVDMDKRTIQPGWCWRNVGWVHGCVSLCVPCDMDMMLRGCCTSTGMMLCKLSPPISPSCLFFCFSLPFISSPSLLPSSVSPSYLSPFSSPFTLLSYLHSLLSPYYLLPLVPTFFFFSPSPILLTYSSSYSHLHLPAPTQLDTKFS